MCKSIVKTVITIIYIINRVVLLPGTQIKVGNSKYKNKHLTDASNPSNLYYSIEYSYQNLVFILRFIDDC